MLNAIYYTEENPMDVVNSDLQTGQQARNKKQVSNVQTEEVQASKRKGHLTIKSST